MTTNTRFIVAFDCIDNTGQKTVLRIDVKSDRLLDTIDDCDNYVDEASINSKCFDLYYLSLINSWFVESMSTHTDTEMSFTLAKSKTKNDVKRKNIAPETKSLASTIETGLAVTTPIQFLKMFFGNVVGMKEPLIWNGIEHMYISSGSTRDVYVDPTWSYVIKVNGDSMNPMSGNQFNALEVWDYWNTVDDEELPKVMTKLVTNETGSIMIQQDFLIVLNTSRCRINTMFEDVFTPIDSYVTDVYGYQYGWNRKTGRVELYDTSDAYLGRGFVDNSFESSYDLFDIEFKNYDCFQEIHFRQAFKQHCISSGIWQKMVDIDKRPWCQLLHQDGLLLNWKDRTITICGTSYDEIRQMLEDSIDTFIKEYQPNYVYFMASEAIAQLTE